MTDNVIENVLLYFSPSLFLYSCVHLAYIICLDNVRIRRTIFADECDPSFVQLVVKVQNALCQTTPLFITLVFICAPDRDQYFLYLLVFDERSVRDTSRN